MQSRCSHGLPRVCVMAGGHNHAGEDVPRQLAELIVPRYVCRRKRYGGQVQTRRSGGGRSTHSTVLSRGRAGSRRAGKSFWMFMVMFMVARRARRDTINSSIHHLKPKQIVLALHSVTDDVSVGRINYFSSPGRARAKRTGTVAALWGAEYRSNRGHPNPRPDPRRPRPRRSSRSARIRVARRKLLQQCSCMCSCQLVTKPSSL